MRNIFKGRDKRSDLQKEKDDLAAKLRQYQTDDIGSVEYLADLELIEKLGKIIAEDHNVGKKKIDPNEVMKVGGNLLIGLVVLFVGKFADWVIDKKPLEFMHRR